MLLLGLSVVVAFAATGQHAKAKQPAPRPLKYACASDLYNAKDVLHFVSRPKCKGAGKKLVKFAADYPVYVCRKEHGGFVASQRARRFPYPLGIRPYGPAGLIRVVSDPSKCAPQSQPNETPVTLPQSVTRLFCAAKKGGELRWVSKVKSCDEKEFPVRLAARVNVGSGNGTVKANDDTATTDENSSTNINVLGNDTGPGSSGGLVVDSVDTTGTIGTVTVNGDNTITYNPNGHFEALKPGQTATDSFKYKARKNSVKSGNATVTVTITGVNDAPVAADDSATTDEDSPKTISVLSNDTDADGDALHVGSVDKTGTQGNVTVNGDNTVTYDPNHKFDSLKPGDTATDTFKYKANDGSADSNAATVTVTITGLTDAPVVTTSGGANPSFTEQGAPVTVDGGVTVTDSDSANLQSAKIQITTGRKGTDSLSFTAPGGSGITGAAYDSSTGILALSGSSSVANYQDALRSVKFSNSSDTPGTSRTVVFTAKDDTAESAPASRNITLVPVNDTPVAHDDSGTTNEDATLTKNAATGVLSNDTDADGDPLTASLVSGPAHASSFTLNADGSYSYTPAANYNGPDSFTYKANDGTADSNTATVSLTVTAVNDAPVANDDSGSTNEDTPFSTTAATGVLSNDTDVEGNSLTASLVNGPAHAASFTLNSDGSYSYTPDADYNGPDSFTYKANDGSDDSNVATVSITVNPVNDAPVVDLNGSGSAGSDATASFTEDSPAASVAPSADVTDVDSNLVSATITLTNHPDGTAESLNVATTGTSITAAAYNSSTGVLALSGSDTPAHYQQVIRSLTYDNSSNTPNTTSRVINVKVNDGSLDSNEPHSTVSVAAHNDAPTATDQTGAGAVSGTEDTGSSITLAGTDPENDPLTFTHDSASANGGTITGIGSSVNYSPAANFCGTDSFQFTVDDGNGGTDTGTVEINVACVNDAPVVTVSSGSASYTEGGSPVPFDPGVTVTDVDDTTLSGAVVDIGNNFTSADGDTLSMSPNPQNGITATYNSPGPGFLTLSGTSSVANYQAALRTVAFSLTSDNPSGATRGIQVQVTDPHGSSSVTQGRDMTVTPTNDAPAADNQSASTSEDTPKGITLTGSDPENDAITFHSDQPSHGSVSPTTGSAVTYTPAADYCGPDSFTFHTNDGTADSANGTVSITVSCVNDAPVVDLNGAGGGTGETRSFTEDGGAVAVAPSGTVSDVDNANLASMTVTLTNRPDTTAESLSASVAGTSITADAYDNSTGQLFLHGSDTTAHYQQVLQSVAYNNTSQNPDTADRLINVKVNDGALDSNEPHTTMSVNRANDAPTADNQTLSTNEDTALPITLTGSDIDGDSLTYSSDQPAHGSVSPSTGTSVTYTPAADYCGPDSFTFHTNDGTVDSANGTISITVNCVNDAPVVDLNGPAAGTGTNPSFAEQIAHTGGATTLAPNGTVTDVDDTHLESLTVTLVNHPDNASEFLTADTTGTSITADAYNSSTGVLLLHGHDTLAHYQQVLRTVAYENDAAPPNSTSRTIDFVANDGDADSAPAVSTVSVVPLNAPPVTDLNGTGSLGFDTTASFTEDAGPATLAPSADVSDADDPNLVSATITLASPPDGGAESLAATTAGTSITADAYVPATGVLFLHGSDTVAHYQQVLRTVAYNNTSNTPNTANRSVSFKVNDGQDDSNTATATVSVTAHNDAPTATDQSVSTNEDTAKGITLSGTDPENDSLSFTYDSASAQGGTITGLAPDVTYTPAANYCGPDSFNFQADDGNGGTDTGTISITVTCVNDAPVVDLNGAGAGIDNNAAFTEDQPAVTLATGATVSDVDNANLSSATVVLTNHPDNTAEGLTAVTAGTSITADAYDTSTGVLFLHGSDTLAHYQQVLRSVAYNNTSNTPDSTNRTINWKVNDGSLDSATATTLLSVTPANDAPALDLNGGSAGVNETASYTEDQPATTLAPNTLASDPDNTNLQSATVTLTNHPDNTAESLSVDTTGTSISAVAYNSGTGVLSLSGSDTVAHYQQVLRTISYLNTSQNANTTNRVVNFVVNDGSSDSNSPTVSVTITVVNDPPVVDMNGGTGGIDSNAAFVEDSSPNVVGTGPVNLGSSATVSDVDNSTLSSATLTLFNHPDGVNESLAVTIPGGNPITTGGYNSSTGVLTLTGPATPAQFQAVIQSAKYNNVSNTPDPTDRDVRIKVNDGTADSTVAHTTVTVTPTNDAPVATDETFNSTNSAIGNTTLNVNDTNNHNGGVADGRPPTPDPTDTSPTTDRPHKEITGDILSNDTDPESANSSLSVTPGTFASNDGGTVTIQADGDWNFEPAPSTSCTDTSDFFDYTVNDNDSGGNASDTGRVTVAITGCVWYVNNNDAQGNSGTSEKPFDTLAQAQTASGANHTIFLYDGDDTTTGYDTGFNMKSGQTLESEGADLVIGSDTLHTADAANKASIKNNNADVVSLNNGTTVKSLNIDPQGTGGGICGGTACGGNATASSTLDDVSIVDNGTKGTQAGLELNGSTGTFNISNLTVNNGDGSSATTGDEGVKLNNAGTVNFASTGTISITTNGAAGLDAAAGAGTTSLGSASTFDGITVTNSGNGGVLLSGTTGSGTAFGDGSGNDMQLTTTQGSTAAFSAQTAGSFSVPSAGQSDVSATGGPAVDVVSSSGSTMPFDGVSSTNSANDGVNIDSIGTGTFSATSGTIGGEAGIGFDLNGGSGAITYPGTFNNGSGSLAAEVTGRTGGVVSLSGSMNDTNDAGGGVNVANNTGGSTVFSGATKQYNTGASDAVTFSNSDGHTFVLSGGGSDIDTTSGNGVNVTTSGTFQVSGSGNTIDSTALGAGNRGLNIADTDLSATGVTFDHINTSGGTNGIRVNNSATAGSLNVTGVGGTCTAADQTGCSGGVIQSATGAGIDLTNVSNPVNLTRMNVKNGGDDGINASSVGTSAGNGIALANSVISGNGNAVNENGIDFLNVLGISSISSTVATGNAENNGKIDANTGTGRFTVSSSTFSNNSTTLGSDGLSLTPQGSSSVRALIQNSTFTANRDDGFQLNAQGDSNVDLMFNNNTASGGNAGAVSAHAALNFDSGTTSNVRMSMDGGTFSSAEPGVGGSAIIVNPAGDNSNPAAAISSTFDGSFNNVTVGQAGVANSGSATGLGMWVKPVRNTDAAISVTNSHINGTSQFGMQLLHNDGQGNSDFTVTGNTFRNIGTGNEPIFVQAGSLSTDVINECADIGGTGGDNVNPPGNDFAGQGSGGVTDIAFRRPSADAGSHLKLPGFSPPASSNLQPYIQGRNVGSPTTANFSGELEAGPASCQQPTPPTAP